VDIRIEPSYDALGAAAASVAARALQEAIAARGEATLVLATGASQFAILEHLVRADVAWSAVTAFHLDEYVGMPASHPASFRRYLDERFLRRLAQVPAFVPIVGDARPVDEEVARLNALLAGRTVDVWLAGIWENGHLAFNDPPADFETRDPYLVVTLDEACRRQQLGEGWFASLDDVPRQAISMSVRRIMESTRIVLSVPDQRKARAVRDALRGPVSPACPASILQRHPDASLFLDPASASLL